MRERDHRFVRGEVGKAQGRQPTLPGAEHLAGAAQPQILLGDAEAVLGVSRRIDSRCRAMSQQDAGRTAGAVADAAAQLVQLCEAEALGVLDHHDGRRRHVDADLDDRRRDQQIGAALGEGRVNML
jgi:hypothetical protein